MRAAGGLWIGHVLKLFDALHVDGMKQRNRFCFANSEVSKREGGSDRPPTLFETSDSVDEAKSVPLLHSVYVESVEKFEDVADP